MLPREVEVVLDPTSPLYTGDRLRDLILCYAGPWAFRPYLRNREDEELLWHARQGVLLAFAEIVIALALLLMGLFPVLGVLSIQLLLPIWLLWCLGMSVTGVLRATKGKRHKIPVIHLFVDFI